MTEQAVPLLQTEQSVCCHAPQAAAAVTTNTNHVTWTFVFSGALVLPQLGPPASALAVWYIIGGVTHTLALLATLVQEDTRLAQASVTVPVPSAVANHGVVTGANIGGSLPRHFKQRAPQQGIQRQRADP